MRSKLITIIVAGMLVPGYALAQSGADLAKSKNCMGCHDIEKKKVGPSFKDIAAKYKGNKEAESKLAAALKEGKGHPVKATASDAELKAILQYVLSAN